MRALVFDGAVRLTEEWPEPQLKPGWAVVRVGLCGICRTDLEIARGYMGYRGAMGHEFVGVVEQCDDAEWVGKRVVGEINAACGDCDWCRHGLQRHCPGRTVLGIVSHDGCMAERCALPVENLHEVPEGMADEQAVFCEPVSAAFEMLEQVDVARKDRCIVLGDGKLGILCSWALATASGDVTLCGHHPHKVTLADWGGVRPQMGSDGITEGADIVVEATGSASGFSEAVRLCRPRGVLILKSTIAADTGLNLAPVVVNEITIVGSRCGPFGRGLREMSEHRFPVERLITARYDLSQGLQAFQRAEQRDALKVLVRCG